MSKRRREMEDVIRSIIKELFCEEFLGDLIVHEISSCEGSVETCPPEGYEVHIGLPQISTRSIFFAKHDSDKDSFFRYIKEELIRRRLDFVQMFQAEKVYNIRKSNCHSD